MVVSLFLGLSGFWAGSRLAGTNSKYWIVRSSHLYSLVSARNQDIPGIRHAGRQPTANRQRIRNRLGVGSDKSNARIPRVARIPKSIDSQRAGSTERGPGNILSTMGCSSGVLCGMGKAECVYRSLQ